VTNNSTGVAGTAFNAKVVPVRVLGKCGGYPSDIADAIVWASGGTGSGDADLYVRSGSAPTDTVYTCRPYLSGNNEACTISAPAAGTWHVRVKAYSTFSGLTLTAQY
jgi:serine protease